MRETIIHTDRYSQIFGDRIVVRSINLEVPQGSIFGLLGANGAGKTTTLRALMGHIFPTSGIVQVLGKEPWQLTEVERQRISYVGDPMDLPSWMTPQQAFDQSAAFYPRWDAKTAYQWLFDLDIQHHVPYNSLSKGQKRQLLLLLALCQNTDVLILDEPMTGLDVAARRFWMERIVESVAQEERTVLISSHLLTDLERIVDRIAVLAQGHLVVQDELDALKERVRRIRIPHHVPLSAIHEHFQVLNFETEDEFHTVVILNYTPEALHVLCESHRCQTEAEDYDLNLEDMFLEFNKTAQLVNASQEGIGS